MARTPQHALAALNKTHTDLLRNSTHTSAEAMGFGASRTPELLVMLVPHARTPKQLAAKLRTIRFQ
jgi:hypothetical protein